MKPGSAFEGARRLVALALIGGSVALCACSGVPAAALTVGTAAAQSSARASSEPAKRRLVSLHTPEAPGTITYEAEGITVDVSNVSQGYVMIKCAPQKKKCKVRIGTDAYVYTYDLHPDGVYETYPFQQGSGTYTVRVLENVEGDLYSPLLAEQIEVRLADENLPFLYPSQYVKFDASSQAVAQSFLLVGEETDETRIADTLFRYVAGRIRYDNDKAAAVAAGYLPDADETLASGKGICFDYSALLATMLRAQNIPVKLVIGIVVPENVLHAWNSVLLSGRWVLYDATLAGEGHKDADYTPERIY